MADDVVLIEQFDDIYEEINLLIQQRKNAVKKAVNDAMVSLYWGIGKRLQENISPNTENA